MARGILPSVLLAQVRATAAWALELDAPFARTLLAAPELDATFGERPLDYLRTLLAAHFVTVATFCPTDVDTAIRHHLWWAIEDRTILGDACAIVDEVASWDPRLVSARTVGDGAEITSGHDGEWFSVRAGALGRALSLGADDLVEALVSRIDDELTREAALFDRLLRRGEARAILGAATLLAHNLGDLSRVVEAWPKVDRDDARALRARYVRLGHETSKERTFVTAGAINKQIMAKENDRFLALREAKALRASRELILGIGPFFDEWGERVGRAPLLDDAGRAEALSALLDTHVRRPEQQGCLRAIAGMHRTLRGGVESLADDVPARLRKLLRGGAVREHFGLDRGRFEQRMEKRLDAALAEQGLRRGA